VRRRFAVVSLLVAVAAVIVVVASGSSAKPSAAPADASTTSSPRGHTPRTSATDPLPTRNRRAQVVEPVAGETSASAALPVEQDPSPAQRPQRAASATLVARLKRNTGPTRSRVASASGSPSPARSSSGRAW